MIIFDSRLTLLLAFIAMGSQALPPGVPMNVDGEAPAGQSAYINLFFDLLYSKKS
jgi:hypothetical protein